MVSVTLCEIALLEMPNKSQSLRLFTSTHEKWNKEQRCCVDIFVDYIFMCMCVSGYYGLRCVKVSMHACKHI